MKTIGVLGGMGPESTALFYLALIKQCQKQYGARYDEDYPEIFIYNLPIPDVVEGLKKPQDTRKMLIKGAKKLESIGVAFLVMPCNTAHYFYWDIAKSINIPFLGIVQETSKKTKSFGYEKVGILATETTLKYQIYQRDFNGNGIDIIEPKRQARLTKIIMNVLGGIKLDSDKDELKKIIYELKKEGAQTVVLGCTDLSVIFNDRDFDTETLIDTVDVLAESAIKFAMQ